MKIPLEKDILCGRTARMGRFRSAPRVAQCDGIALVIVLSLLVLVAVIIISFFTSVTTEFSSSQSSANAADTKQLAEAATNMVMAQVVTATTGTGAGGSRLAWTSQPGMIRTFDNTGAAASFYKLYSSDAMVVDGSSFSTTNEAPPAGWNSQPSIYTDLNSPVLVPDPNGKITKTGGTYTADFPVIDGNNLVDGSTVTPAVPANPPAPGATYLTYYTGTNGAAADIQGFYVQKPSTYNSGAQLSGTNNPVPMPVKWLYVLQDGTILVPQSTGNGSIADFSGAATPPSASNPIVGRIAFWSDDETCKVNINTAAGDQQQTFPIAPSPGITFGSFWDIPRTVAPPDLGSNGAGSGNNFVPGFAWSQPYENEFQRYPGHPATVALSTIFPAFTRAEIGAIVPRVQDGGSHGGTTQLNAAGTSINTDADRLYASIDELMFKPSLSGSSPSRDQNQVVKITRDKLEQSKFFLTASSRAPDLNLFAQPRITIWPITTTAQTSHDKLIAFCSTIGKSGSPGSKTYYFQRTDATSTTSDYANIQRNQDLYKYLQNLTSSPIPGFGQDTFLAKYGNDRDQILTEIFDYIRCTNLVDPNPDAKPYTAPSTQRDCGLVAPITIGSTKGFGRFPTLMEATLQFYTNNYVTTAGVNYPQTMQAVLLFNLFDPMAGYAGVEDDIYETASFTGDWSVSVSGTSYPLGFPNSAQNHILMSSGSLPQNSRGYGGVLGPQAGFQCGGGNTKTLGSDPETSYAFYGSNSIATGTNQASVFNFSSGTGAGVVLTLAHGANKSVPIQTFYLNFPPGQNWPIPIIGSGTAGISNTVSNVAQCNYNLRMSQIFVKSPSAVFLDHNDTTRSLVARGGSSVQAPYGDLRLVALTGTVPSTVFSPHVRYSTNGGVQAWNNNVAVTNRTAHSLRTGYIGAGYYGYTGTASPTSMVPIGTSSYVQAAEPVIPAGITDITLSGSHAGDFDNGFANVMDGPYVNKPDEGTLRSTTGASAYALPYFQSEMDLQTQSFFSPNRQIASAVMFGSLPSGASHNIPWQTLLFRPDPAGKHPGSIAPKDHLLLDLFTMPVVEPYAISEPFSTAGRINMNYQIMPFGPQIVRETAVRSALESTWIIAIPPASVRNYKSQTAQTSGNYRYPIDVDTTLRQFSDRFTNADNRNFVSASQICDIDLYPGSLSNGTSNVAYDPNGTNMQAFWAGNTLTGDNSREMPYNHLYPLLTTKSNTFTVHMRVQALKQITGGRLVAADWQKWVEGKDQVSGEYRGSTTIERYIDPNDPRFTNGAVNPDTDPVDPVYKFRVVSVKKFAP